MLAVLLAVQFPSLCCLWLPVLFTSTPAVEVVLQ
jgi:hypothetical protein